MLFLCQKNILNSQHPTHITISSSHSTLLSSQTIGHSSFQAHHLSFSRLQIVCFESTNKAYIHPTPFLAPSQVDKSFTSSTQQQPPTSLNLQLNLPIHHRLPQLQYRNHTFNLTVQLQSSTTAQQTLHQVSYHACKLEGARCVHPPPRCHGRCSGHEGMSTTLLQIRLNRFHF